MEEATLYATDVGILTGKHRSIMGRWPEEWQSHPVDDGRFADAQDLPWENFVLLTTTQAHFNVSPSVRRIDAVRALEEFTLPPIL